MKKFFLNTAFILSAVVCALTFASCGGDDGPEPGGSGGNDSQRDKIKVEYNLNLSENWYKFFDVEITYKIGESVETKPVTGNGITTVTLPYTEETYNDPKIAIVVKPKANAPAIEDGVNYKFSKSANISTKVYLKDGNIDPTVGELTSPSSTHTIPSKNMQQYISQEHTIFGRIQ